MGRPGIGQASAIKGEVGMSGRDWSTVRRAALLAGAAAGAIMLAAAPEEARAQARPGDPQCPIVNRIVTCSGNVADGIDVPAGADRDGLTVENLTADIVVTTRPAIAFTAGTPNTTIRIVDPDNALRLSTVSTSNPDQPDRNQGIIAATALNNNRFSLLSDIDIFGRSTCPVTDCTFRRDVFPTAILVRGSLGTFTIENRGDIDLNNRVEGGVVAGRLSGVSAGIVADIFGADLVSIRNAGNINILRGAGIMAAADNRRIEIVNDGLINIDYPAVLGGEDRSLMHGITLTFDVRQLYLDSFSRPDVPQLIDFSYRIVNNGTIDTNFGQTQNQDGINVSNIYTVTRPDGTPGDRFVAGRQIGEIINNGSIDTESVGIRVEQNGDLTIINNGRIEGNNGIDTDQLIPDVGTVGGVPLTRIVNSASGIIEVVVRSGDPSLVGEIQGITADGGVVDITNAGRISVQGVNFNQSAPDNYGIDVEGDSTLSNDSGLHALQLVTIANSGEIAVSANQFARGVRVSRVHGDPADRAPDQRTVISNSGTISAAGTDSIALLFENEVLDTSGQFDRLVAATIGTTDIDLAATSIIRGGSGANGAGILFTGGERNTIRNAGLITAPSGRAIVGGIGVETIDNSGRIEGSVVLAAGDDRVIARGGLFTGPVDGGDGNDVLQADVASGTAAFSDRIAGAVTGFELFEKTGSGVLSLTSVVAPRADLLGGALRTNGALGGLAVNGAAGTVLEATGALGAVTLANGAALSPGGSTVTTLQLASLSLSGTSILRYDLGAPGVIGGAESDLINISGNLTLDGSLDINARPNFGAGVYRLINYGGALTDNGLVIGTAPAATYNVQTSVAGQVNLVVGAMDDLSMQFWDDGDTSPDGMVDGGVGTWTAGRTNWTNVGGTANNAWAGNFAVFQTTGGAITVEGQQGVTGMQFMANGYRLSAGAGGALSLNAAETIVRVDPGISAELALPLVGNGALVKRDTGTLILSGTNSYAGGTMIREGVLQVAADNNLGAAAGGVTLDGGALRFAAAGSSARGFTIGAGGGTIDHANALTLSGAISGSGALAKTGSGTLTLSGNSAARTGATNIAAGTLDLTGQLGGTITIASGATLTGTGTLGNLILAGTVAPGGTTGILTVTGDVTFRAGSTYRTDLAASGAGDRINAGGRAILEGGTVAVTALDPELNYTDGTVYRILNATGGRTGTFAGLTETSAFLDFALGYDPTGAFLTVDVIRTFPDVAATFNQTQASTGLMGLDRTPGSDSLAVYNALLILDEDSARAAFDASSGEIYAGMLAVGLREGQQRGDRLVQRAYAESGEGWGLWGGVNGHDGQIAADGNGGELSHDGIGGDLGIDYRGAGNAWAVGVSGGYNKGDIDLLSRGSRADYDGWHLGAYARYGTGGAGFSVAASATIGRQDAEVARAISFPAISRTARAKVDLDTTALAIEGRYGFGSGAGWSFGPVASASWTDADLGDIDESGADSLNLSGSGSSDRTGYGGGAFVNWRGARGSIDASVQYVTGDDRRSEARLAFAGAAETPFRVRAAEASSGAALVKLSGDYDLGGGWSVGGDLRGVFNGEERSLAGAAAIRLRF